MEEGRIKNLLHKEMVAVKECIYLMINIFKNFVCSVSLCNFFLYLLANAPACQRRICKKKMQTDIK